jgi:hypothetical protein
MELKVDALIERTQGIRESLPLPHVKQRLAQAAQGLSHAGDNQLRVELLMESVLAATALCYECDQDGQRANIDGRTYRLLVAAPWGDAGWKRWGLREWEARILRQILIARVGIKNHHPLFDYNAQSHIWSVALFDYPTLDIALRYWKRHPITLAEWHAQADPYRQQASERTARKRGRKRRKKGLR